MKKIARGQVWLVQLGPTIGTEIQKTMPAVVVSVDASNKVLDRAQVIPVTSNVERLYPPEAYVTIKGKQHKAMADQITTASRKRFLRKVGQLSAEDMHAVENAIRVQLGLR